MPASLVAMATHAKHSQLKISHVPVFPSPLLKLSFQQRVASTDVGKNKKKKKNTSQRGGWRVGVKHTTSQTVSLSAATHLQSATFGIVCRNTEICAKYLKHFFGGVFLYLFLKSQPLHSCGQLLFVYIADIETAMVFILCGGGFTL